MRLAATSLLVPTAILLSGALASPVLDARQANVKYYNIHPGNDTSKCIGVLGGQFVAGSYVDIYDCNGSATQKWSWGPPVDPPYTPMNLFVKNPANGEELCMDVNPLNAKPGVNDLYNGVKLVLKQCDKTERFGRPTDLNAFGTIEYGVWYYPDDGPGTGQLCVDLTNGDKTNRNVLQLWSCNPEWTEPWKNQIWSMTQV